MQRLVLFTTLFCSLGFGICGAQANWFCNDKDDWPMANYQADCARANKFFALTQNACFKDHAPQDLRFYKGLRLMGERHYTPASKASTASMSPTAAAPENVIPLTEILKPGFTTKGENSVYARWEQGNTFIASKITANLDDHKWHPLTVEDVQQIHREIISADNFGSNNDAMKSKMEILKTTIFKTRTETLSLLTGETIKTELAPGELREGSFPTHKIATTPEILDILKEDPLVLTGVLTLEHPTSALERGRVMATDFWNLRPFYPAGIKYTDSTLVRTKLEQLLTKINHTMQSYWECQSTEDMSLCPATSPIAFAAEVQREFVSIHPFNDGCGRTSRMVQDLILGSLDFPFIPGGLLQDDVTTPTIQYATMNETVMDKTLGRIERCCQCQDPAQGCTHQEAIDCRFVDEKGLDIF